MIPQDVILYSWLDVEEVLFRSSEEGDMPQWIISKRAYWDSLSLSVSPGKSDEALSWLAIKFEPRFDEANQSINLESDGDQRSLHVSIEEADEEPYRSRFMPSFSRPSVLRRRIENDLPSSLPQDLPHVVAFHSFKGGVGRTVHALGLALALAEKRGMKVLLIDGDLEAPGLSWLFGKRIPKPPISYTDFLTLVHGDSDPNASMTLKLVANRLKDMLVDGIYIMPAFRSINKFISLDIKPEHLVRGSKDPYILTSLLSRLGKELGVDLVIVDLRAGLSEISASLLLDPRVYRVLVTTISGQSFQGTKLMLELLGKVALSRRSDEPLPALIIAQVPEEETEGTLDRCLGDLIVIFSNLAVQIPANSGEEPTMAYSVTPFNKDLVVLPDSWDDTIRRIRKARLDEGLMGILDWLPNPQKPVMRLDDRRIKLAEYSGRVVYAETGEITDFLRIRPLNRLASEFRTKVPIAVVIGAKGSGKTLTFLQLAREKEWSKFAGEGLNQDTIKAVILPVIRPLDLKGVATSIVDDAKRYSAQYLGLSEPCTWEYISDNIHERLLEELHEGRWRDQWLDYIAWSSGFEVGKKDAGRRFTDYLRKNKSYVVAIIDGLENQFVDLASNKRQQVAVRSLLQDVPNWLEQQVSRPLGILIVIRKDMVFNALPQNSSQFMEGYRNYELNWSSDEALRLFAWIAMKAGALEDQKRDQLLDLTGEDLVQELIPLWGRKLGRENSREAFSANWVLYALSDFNGQIQARDIVRFLHYASERSRDDSYWPDRILVPSAIRGSLPLCSHEKVKEIIEENLEIKRIFERISNVSIDKKRVPFDQRDLGLEPSELDVLERNGVISHYGEKYYIPEIFREGLGFTLDKGARPKVVAMAIRAQSQRKNLI
ncbi:MAG: AAA family ATPase [Methanotrichaceae archaeon]|nr:AAA family ATPase [Methanotrichaceae archaeon]